MTTPNPPPLVLSPRQAAIACLIASGESTKHIALEMHLSQNTVKVYLARARDRIVKACPEVKPGTPRAVIIRYYAYVERKAFNHQPETQEAA